MKYLRLLVPFCLIALLYVFSNSPDPKPEQSSSGSKTSPRKNPSPQSLFSPAPKAFETWLTTYQADPTTADFQTGITLVTERRAALKNIIQLDPEKALQLSIPKSQRESLPPEIESLLETPVSTAAEFEHVVSCYLGDLIQPAEAPSEERFVTFNDTRYRAFTFGRRANLHTKDRISLHGISIDDVVAVDPNPVKSDSDNPLVVEAFGEKKHFDSEDERDYFVAMLIEGETALGPEIPSSNSEIEASPWTEGNKRILYLRVRFADDDPTYTPVTLATAQSHQDDVAEHYRIASYGKLHVTTVFPDVITLTQNKSEYVGQGLGAMMNEARAAAIVMGDAQGVDWDYNNFDFYTIISDGGIGPYAGVAQVGGRKSHHQKGYTSLRTSGHEFGHNLGLSHANYNLSSDLSPRGSTPTEGVTNIEYGHRFSVMSAQGGSDLSNPTLPHFTVHEKWRIDWLTDADMVDITSGNQNGTYRLFQNDQENATGLRALRIPSGGSMSKYWLSYRTAWAQPNRSSDNDFLLNGVLFNWTGSGGGKSTLLDMTPYSNSSPPTSTGSGGDNSDKWDAPLLVGRTYTDPDNKVSVTPIARGGSAPDEYLDVFVHLNTGSEITLVEEDASCTALIPDVSTPSTWTDIAFDDSTWPYSGTLGVGYDTGTVYNPYFDVDLIAMRNNNESCFIRVPFTIDAGTDPADIESLTLKMRYDDGFVAYLNGVRIAAQNEPDSLDWESGADDQHSDGAAVIFESFSANEGLGSLVVGQNVLAIHGLNNGVGSSDFLIQPVLTATLAAPDNLAPDVTLTANTLVTAVNQDITFTASGTDPEGDTLAYAWDFDIDDTFAPEGMNSPTATRSWSNPGHYVVTITCSDRKGGLSRDRVLVKVGSPSNTGTISGRVLQGGQPVAGARVFVEGTDRQYFTLPDGSYLISRLSTSSSTTLGAMVDGEVFQPSTPMPLTPNPELNGINFFAHSSAPAGSPDQTITVTPQRASTDTASTVQLDALLWDDTIAEDLLVPFGDTWSYLDTGGAPDASWNTDGFDDSAWLSGPAELGYGDSQNTAIGFGPDSASKNITTWFRHTFSTTNVADVSRLELSVKRDDGIRIFLNGTEIARDNITTGTISATTTARNEVTSANEGALLYFNVDPTLLIEGTNVLAAEVHLEDGDSNDLSFDLQLSAARDLSAITPTWSVSPSGASVSATGLFSATDPGSYTVTATSGAISAEAYIDVATDNVVTIAALDRVLWENETSTPTIQLTRSGSTSSSLTVPLSISGSATSGADYSGVPASITFLAGETSASFNLTLLDDSTLEGDETLSITPAFSSLFTVGSPALTSLTFIDDENATIQNLGAGDDATVTVNDPLNLSGISSLADQFIVAGDYWKFDDSGTEPTAGWKSLPFDDSSWSEGLAQFGYGNSSENTTISFGPNSSSKHITTWFRRRFHLDDPADYSALTATLLLDDGAVIYINGAEAERINLLDGITITSSTRAQDPVGGGDEDTFFEYALDPADLVAGENVIAVEVHQSSPTSSDLGFDLTLEGTRPPTGTLKWTLLSGTGNTVFSDDTASAPTVAFDQPGNYILQLEALSSGLTDQVTVTVQPSQSYQLWLGGYSLSDSTPLGDPDQDGLANLVEYALGADPSTSNPGLTPTLAEDPLVPDDLFFTYRRLKELNPGDASGTTANGYSLYGINYTVQAGQSLDSWNPAATALTLQQEGTAIDNSDGTETITLRLTPPAPSTADWFIRLRIEAE
ncbi:PKD domain-containing protein [bacterium]|nr:PKD domain-containing protein [bacterium]